MSDITTNYVLCFTAGLIIGLFKKQIIAYIKSIRAKKIATSHLAVEYKKESCHCNGHVERPKE